MTNEDDARYLCGTRSNGLDNPWTGFPSHRVTRHDCHNERVPLPTNSRVRIHTKGTESRLEVHLEVVVSVVMSCLGGRILYMPCSRVYGVYGSGLREGAGDGGEIVEDQGGDGRGRRGRHLASPSSWFRADQHYSATKGHLVHCSRHCSERRSC